MAAISQRILLIFPTFILFLPTHVATPQRLDPSTADQEALLAFRSGITDDPNNAFENWLPGIHVCDWKGVECGNDSTRVINLSLFGLDLTGTISPFLSNLSYLQYLDLSANSLHGTIPQELGSLTMINVLTFSQNQLDGLIPLSFGFLSDLGYVSLSKNMLQGRLPLPLFYNCTKLTYVDLSDNSLVGFIPSLMGNRLQRLEQLFLYNNQLAGNFPASISNCSSLVDLDLEFNYLGGQLPNHVFKYVTSLQTLHLSYNSFTSDDGNTNLFPFFHSLANLTHLTELELAANGIGGELPEVIGLLRTNLSQLQLDGNLIHGAIPRNITSLSNLMLLNLSSNILSGAIPAELSLLPLLERLCLSNNSLHGPIPAELGNLPHLGLLDLSKNNLSGSIPSSLSNLTQLRELKLSNNHLSGAIPASLGKCQSLEILDLAYNNLNDSIPGEVAALEDLTKYFNASNNLLIGNLPVELSKMNKVRAIDLSSNQLTGEIPPNLAGCEEAEMINLSHNQLQGSIPSSFGELLSIQSLDLSQNHLTGQIPPSLKNCSSLSHLNLSFNNLTGSVPGDGLFASLTVNSYLNNPFLCGSLLGLPPCHPKYQPDDKQLYSKKFLLVLVTIVSGSAFLFTILCALTCRNVKNSLKTSSKGGAQSEALHSSHPRITYNDLMEATGGFHERLLVGFGSFGHVYKGVLRDNRVVAVKVLQMQAQNSCMSFNRECQVLKRIRHRNLMRIVTACSLPDFKALVLPFMANGSLESHLHGARSAAGGCCLRLVERVGVCSDVAEGMAYLHHHSPVQVIHCDLKPSNILLDQDMTALVSDFGIARLVMKRGDGIGTNSTSSTANLLCGSVGYIAPEYGMGRGASTKGDVYSFGILVLEMVTRKRPTDDMFSEDLSLKQWVKTHYRGRLEKVIDSVILSDSMNQSQETKNIWETAVIELIDLGLLCTQDAPSTRPTMLDAADDLNKLKTYLSAHTATATFASSPPISSSILTTN